MRHGHVLQSSCNGGELFFFACPSALFYLLICFPKLPFAAAQVIRSASESPLITSYPRPWQHLQREHGPAAERAMFAHLSGEQLPPPCLGEFRQPPTAVLQGRPVSHRCLYKVSVPRPSVPPPPPPRRRRPTVSSLSSVGDCCLSLIRATC